MTDYEKDYHASHHDNLYTDEEYYRVRSQLAFRKYFKDLDPESKVLEFGCGMGQNIALLKHAVGYDISQFSLDFCRKKGISVVGSLGELEDHSFDVVFSSHVIEHLERPLDLLRSMHSKLKPGGKLIILVPVEWHRRAKSFALNDNEHIYSWNFSTLNNLLIRAGFRISDNSYLRGIGFKKFLFVSRFSFPLYHFLTSLLSFFFTYKEMKVLATKD